MSKAVIFDLDGTIYFGNKIAPYALEVLDYLEKSGYEIIFFTNNSTKTRENILQKLLSLNIKTNIDRVYTSSYATAKYANENKIHKVFLIGTDDFKSELNKFNIDVVDELTCDAVLIGLDVTFNYNQIAKALRAVNKGAKIIASNVDMNFPIEDNILRPGSNAIVGALLGCSGKKVDYIVGKPNTYLLESIVTDFHLNKNKVWVIGDSLESDIAMANNFDCKSILVDQNCNLKNALNIIIREEQ